MKLTLCELFEVVKVLRAKLVRQTHVKLLLGNDLHSKLFDLRREVQGHLLEVVGGLLFDEEGEKVGRGESFEVELLKL